MIHAHRELITGLYINCQALHVDNKATRPMSTRRALRKADFHLPLL